MMGSGIAGFRTLPGRLLRRIGLCWLCLRFLLPASAEMAEVVTGKVFPGPGGHYGFQTRSVQWTGGPEFRTHHLSLGPVEFTHLASRLDGVGNALPSQVALRIGSWGHTMLLDSGKRFLLGALLVMVILASIGAGAWRRRATDGTKVLPPVPTLER